MIAIDDLTFSYRESEFRLSIRTLRVRRGEKLAVIGPSVKEEGSKEKGQV